MFIYLLFKYLYLATARSAHINTKGREKKERRVRRVKKRKGIEAQRGIHPNPSRTNWCAQRD